MNNRYVIENIKWTINLMLEVKKELMETYEEMKIFINGSETTIQILTCGFETKIQRSCWEV